MTARAQWQGSAPWPGPAGTYRVATLVAVASVLSLALLALEAWHVRNTFAAVDVLRHDYARVESLRDQLWNLDHTLNLAAFSGVATGQPHWWGMHDDLAQAIDTLTAQAIDLHAEGYAADALAAVQEVSKQLREVEREALTLARAGSSEEAWTLLTGGYYGQLQSRFRRANDRFMAGYRTHVDGVLHAEGHREGLAMIVAGTVFATSAVIWTVLVVRLERSRRAMGREYTEHLEAEVRAHEVAGKYRSLFEHADDAILLVDPQTRRLLDANESASRTSGYSRTELRDLRIADLLPDLCAETGADLERCLREAARLGSAPILRRKEGTGVPVEVRGGVGEWPGGRALYAFIRDVSARERLQEELLQAQKLEVVGQLASGVAHDFNNLLTAIRGYVGLAQESLPETHAARRALLRVEQAASQASAVTRSLLSFGRRGPTSVEPVDLGALVADMGQFMRHLLPASIGLEVDAQGHDPLWVRADPSQLQQVLLNLAVNARDAMPSGGRLTLAVQRDTLRPAPAATDADVGADGERAAARVTVTDTGHGMPVDVRRRVFEAFFTTKPGGKGTGLGLPLVHSVVTRHGGRVQVDSEVDHGTTVTFWLPLLESAASSAPTLPVADADPTAGRDVILLAENHTYVREVVASSLQLAGYEVIQVADGRDVLAAWKGHGERIGLVVLDIDLPGLDGPGCLQALRSAGATVPAILTTGSLDPALERRVEGEALLLQKPFRMDELVSLATGLIGRRGQPAPV